MIEYWSVIGRMVVDTSFRETLLECNVPKEKTHSQLAGLYGFLCGPVHASGCGLRLSRWEVCDLNRIVSHFEPELSDLSSLLSKAVKLVQDSWCDALQRSETWGLLGLLLIDKSLLNLYLGAADADAVRTLTKSAPVFHLETGQEEHLYKLFQVAGSGLRALSEKAWIPPENSTVILAALVMGASAALFMFKSSKTEVQCSGGQTLMAQRRVADKLAYTHLAPPFVDRLAARVLPQRIATFLGI